MTEEHINIKVENAKVVEINGQPVDESAQEFENEVRAKLYEEGYEEVMTMGNDINNYKMFFKREVKE